MIENSLDNRRVAKNTIVLYIRTILTLCISLYTSRVILKVLGVDDYGVYTVIAGFVSMFSIVGGTLVSATQRYLNFELGKRVDNHVKEVFSSSFIIHVALCIITLLLFESFGLWFINCKLNIDPTRLNAANWLYQFSIFTFLLTVLRSPFDASIIAHERMKVFAYANILEAILRLIIVYCLTLTPIDYLVMYGVFLFLISIIIFLIYVVYCRKNFSETNIVFVKDKAYYKGMLSFAGYNFLGSASYVFAQQGVNMLLNIFFGVTVNAARGITVQVESAISKFVSDFTTALNPQITKSYAQNNIDNMEQLITMGSKFAFLLFMFFAIPISIKAPFILKIWLGTVPDYTVIFVRLALLDALINSLGGPLTTGSMATGDIKKLSIWIGVFRFLVFPLSFFAFNLFPIPYLSYCILIICDIILVAVRLIISYHQLNLKPSSFLQNVIVRVLLSAVISFSLLFLISLNQKSDSVYSLLLFVMLSCVTIISVSSLVAFNGSERNKIISLIKNKIRK